MVSVTHTKVSALPDGSDATEVQPSDWNAGHVVTGITDETAKVSSNDTTPGYLHGKLVAGTGVTLTENNDGANETLTIAATGGGGGGGGVTEYLTGDSSIFATSNGSWTNSGGTLTWDSSTHFAGLSGSAKWNNGNSTTNYIEVPVSGTFTAGVEYQAVIGITTEEALWPWDFDLILGVPSVDVSTIHAQSYQDFGSNGFWAFFAVRWVPTANRTTVKLRLQRNDPSRGTVNVHVGYARVVDPTGTTGASLISDTRLFGNNGNQVVVVPLGTSSGAYLTAGEPSLGNPRVMFDTRGVYLIGDGSQDSFIGAFMDSSIFMSGGGRVTSGDKTWGSVEIDVGEGYLDLQMAQKDSNTIQFGAKWGDYDYEFVDGAAGRWKFRSDEDGFSVPSMGMLPQYASAPHTGSEVEGETYYNTTDHAPHQWNGSAWTSSGANFTNDPDASFGPSSEAGYDFPSGRAYIRQFDLGNPGQDAWLALAEGQAQLIGHPANIANPHHGESQLNLNLSGVQADLTVFDDNGTAQLFLSPDQSWLDAGPQVLQLLGVSYRPPVKASAPSSPTEGDTYYDSTLHKMRTWDGSTWQNHW